MTFDDIIASLFASRALSVETGATIPDRLPAGTAFPDVDPFAAEIGAAEDAPSRLIRFGAADVSDAQAVPGASDGAAGEDYLVNAVNGAVQWFAKDGTLAGGQSLDGLFGLSGTGSDQIAYDPRVVYDAEAGRFVVVAVSVEGRDTGTASDDAATLHIAVSHTDNPADGWSVQAIDALTDTGEGLAFADYPMVALNGETIYVSANLFETESGGDGADTLGTRVWSIDKGAATGGLYAGGTSAVDVMDPAGALGVPIGVTGNFTFHPAQGLGGEHGEGQWFVAYNGIHVPFEDDDHLILIHVTEDEAGAPVYTGYTANLGNIDDQTKGYLGFLTEDAPQADDDGLLTNDRRVTDAVVRDGVLYIAFQTVPGEGADAGQTTVHWAAVDLLTSPIGGALGVIDQGAIGAESLGAQTATFMPTIAVNGEGDIAIGFGASNAEGGPGAYVAFREGDAAVGSDFTIETVKSGEAAHVAPDASGRNQWGDYSGLALDPTDDTFWLYNQYAVDAGTDGFWGSAGPILGPIRRVSAAVTMCFRSARARSLRRKAIAAPRPTLTQSPAAAISTASPRLLIASRA